MVLRFHFTFKPFPGHAQERERERERAFAHDWSRHKESRAHQDRPKLRSPRSSAEIIEIIHLNCLPRSPRSREAPCRLWSCLHADRDRVKHRANRNLALAPIAIARSVDRDLTFAPIAISWSTLPIAASRWTQSPLSVPSSLNLTGFDDFFFWVLFVFLYWRMNDIIY